MITAHETKTISKDGWNGAGRTKISAEQGSSVAPGAEVSQNLEKAALGAERKNRALLNTLADLLFVVQKDGKILEFQAPKDSEFAVLSAEISGRTVREFLPAPIAQQVMHYLEKALRTGEMQTFTCQYHLLERVRDFQARIFISGPAEVLALVRDVTEHKLLEKDILEISNREQTRIGQDLHDGLGQHLTGITFLTRALEKRLSAQSLPEAADAAEICKLVVEALTQTRNLARGLFPVELESSGLLSALRELAGTVEQLFSIECHMEMDDQVALGNRVMETHLFRLVQEAINNSVKHGKATRVNVSLKTVEDQIVLSVTDNGSGFPKEIVEKKGLGLRIMKYRAQKMGGTLEICPAENGGAVVTCIIQNAVKES